MNDKTDMRWLAVGALAGLVAAGYGILQQSSPATELPDAAIAMVNDQAIGRDIYERALARFGTPDRDAAGPEILGRLIDDELLVQRGIELGMTESDTEVRAAIVNSLVASLTAEADAASPTDEELEQHLADHADRFSYTSRLSVEAWESDVEPVAQAFVSALRTDGKAPQMEAISALPDLPPDLLSVDTVREYLGPAITAAAAEMPDGSSAVFARRGRWLVVRVVSRERAYVTDVDAVRNRVLLDYRRQLAEDTLQSYIDNLRQRADIRVAQP